MSAITDLTLRLLQTELMVQHAQMDITVKQELHILNLALSEQEEILPVPIFIQRPHSRLTATPVQELNNVMHVDLPLRSLLRLSAQLVSTVQLQSLLLLVTQAITVQLT